MTIINVTTGKPVTISGVMTVLGEEFYKKLVTTGEAMAKGYRFVLLQTRFDEVA